MSEYKSNGARKQESLDAVVIGTGVAGLYQLYKLRDEQGLKVKAFDTASGVGGTWYWNRYPGARFDSEAYIYQYLFSEELYKGWSWSERFPGQPEIERWLNYVADKLDLYKDIRFSTTITSAVYDEAAQRWTITTDKGDVIEAQFLITCCGMLSAPLTSVFPGQDSFKGKLVHTSRWPKQDLDLAGKRVGVVGNGATGIQVIQTIAGDVGSLKVFVRTPQYIIPMKNPKYGPKEVEAYKARFKEFCATLPYSFTGFEYDFTNGNWKDLTAEQREAVLERIWNEGSLRLWLASFSEMFFEDEVSEEISEFVRKKMRARLKDPKLCETLIPTDYGFGTHRVPLESNYLEAYHRENVELVSVKNNPIERITAEGIRLADGTTYAFDVIILATGFDAGTGALTRIDIRGRDGRSLKDEWSRDIRTTMGLQVHGYPNMFTTGAPLAPSTALCNMTTCLQQQVEWISDCIRYLRKNELRVIEPTRETQDAWVAHHDEVANTTLVTKTHSWYMGSNVEGKPRRLLSYIGGVGTYRKKCDEVAATGYLGFAKQ
jgi:cation diffusion facilitator CzcD-associated flavoprotein CzcO